MSAYWLIVLIPAVGVLAYAATRKDETQSVSDEWVREQIYLRGKKGQ